MLVELTWRLEMYMEYQSNARDTNICLVRFSATTSRIAWVMNKLEWCRRMTFALKRTWSVLELYIYAH